MHPYESPTALSMRPTVALRQIPGKTIRVPARSGTLLLIALSAWGVGALALPSPWQVLAGLIGLPAGLLALLAEWKPRGKPLLAWAVVVVRHRRLATLVLHQRLALPKKG
jgi:hypothetical protein